MSSFRDLEIWEKAHRLTLNVYKASEDFPKIEQYRLVDQLCRSASSVPANIAEGKGRNSQREFIQFLSIARGSVEETKYHLLLAKDLGYLEEGTYNEFCEGYDTVGKMLNGLIRKVKKEVEASG